MDITERNIRPELPEPPAFEVEAMETTSTPDGVKVKVTFRNGVKWSFGLSDAKSVDLVAQIARRLTEKIEARGAKTAGGEVSQVGGS